MSDRFKVGLSLFFFVGMLAFPLAALVIGWIQDGIKTGLIAGLVTFAILFVLGCLVLLTVRAPSGLVASLPVIIGMLYTLLPDFLPGPFDDTIIFTGGSLLSFMLWLRRWPGMPKWIIIPLLLASFYTLVGGFIPGPFDEILVYIVLGIISWVKMQSK
jgi:MFS family permease